MDQNLRNNSFASAIRQHLCRLTRTVFYIIGLLGVSTIFLIILMIFYNLSYDYMVFYYLTHVQTTVFRFTLAGTVATLILRFTIRLKRMIWWVWGTQTPNFQPDLSPQDPPNKNLIETARRKGFRYFWGGIVAAYLIALLGFYRVGFAETTFVSGFPEIPILSELLNYLAQSPLITNLSGVGMILPAQKAISIILIGITLTPLTLGLYNISYVFEHNRFIRKNIRSEPLQTATVYFGVIPFGILLLILLGYAAISFG